MRKRIKKAGMLVRTPTATRQKSFLGVVAGVWQEERGPLRTQKMATDAGSFDYNPAFGMPCRYEPANIWAEPMRIFPLASVSTETPTPIWVKLSLSMLV